jgi:hypothetical protein
MIHKPDHLSSKFLEIADTTSTAGGRGWGPYIDILSTRSGKHLCMQDDRQGVKITELTSADLARLTHFAILNNLNSEQTNLSPGWLYA